MQETRLSHLPEQSFHEAYRGTTELLVGPDLRTPTSNYLISRRRRRPNFPILSQTALDSRARSQSHSLISACYKIAWLGTGWEWSQAPGRSGYSRPSRFAASELQLDAVVFGRAICGKGQCSGERCLLLSDQSLVSRCDQATVA